MLEAQEAICKVKPDLRGRFDLHRIWDDLGYLYTVSGMTAQEAANRVLSTLAAKQ